MLEMEVVEPTVGSIISSSPSCGYCFSDFVTADTCRSNNVLSY